jgi:hypothetical protein
MSGAPKFYLAGFDPKNDAARIVHEKRGGRIVFVWRGFPEKNSGRMKLYPKCPYYPTAADGIHRQPFVIDGRNLLREEENEVTRARIEASKAAMVKALEEKKPTPPTPAPGGEYVQTTLFGYRREG